MHLLHFSTIKQKPLKSSKTHVCLSSTFFYPTFLLSLLIRGLKFMSRVKYEFTNIIMDVVLMHGFVYLLPAIQHICMDKLNHYLFVN